MHHDVHRSSSQVAQSFRAVDGEEATDEVLSEGVDVRREGDLGGEDLLVDAHGVVVKERLQANGTGEGQRELEAR